MTAAAAFVLGYGIGCLTITPLTAVIVALISGEDWREVLHDAG